MDRKSEMQSSCSACDETRVFPTFLTSSQLLSIHTNIFFSPPIHVVISPRQDLLSSCLSKTMMKAAAGEEVIKAKDKINIKLFLSQDIHADDGVSDNEHTTGGANNMVRVI